MLRRVLALLLLTLLPGAQGVGTAAAQRTRWVAAGNADGSAAARVPSVRAAPRAAWTQRLSGVLESEPLVWDRNALLSLKERSGRRVLVLMDIASGRRLARQALVATVPLAPSLYGDRIAVRPDPRRVDLLRVSGTRFQSLRSFQSDAPVSEPLLVQGALFLRVGDELKAFLLDRNEPAWVVAGDAPFRGRPSYSDGVLFALRYDGEGRAALVLVDARDGTVLELVGCGEHGGSLPAADAPLSIAVLNDAVFVHFPLPVRGANERTFDVARIPLTRTPNGPRLAEDASVLLFDHAHAPVGTPTGWLALEEADGAPAQWITSFRAPGDDRNASRGLVLADGETHARLLSAPAPAAVGGTVALLGDVAADVATWEILWRLPALPAVRPVPCELAPGEGGWLVAPAPDQLTLLRAPAPRRSAAEVFARERVQGFERREAAALAELAQRALQSGDAKLVSRLVRAATERGIETSGTAGRALALAQDGLARLFSASNTRVNPRSVEALETEEARLYERLPDDLAREALSASDPAVRRALLRALLERRPEHAGAAKAARAMLPPNAPLGSRFDAASWLLFLDVTAAHPVTFERPPEESAETARDVVSELLAREAKEWRPDVVAYRSARLAVITPPGRPGSVARALAVGELVCDVLEEMLPVRGTANDEPLVLLLYEDAREYRTQSERDRSVPEVARGWTVGHYDPRDNLSRMFVPPGDDDHTRLLGTYAHELTHHWLATRSPFASAARRAQGGRERPGFWLVEGVANLVGELAFDPIAGTWSADNPRASSLDGVANAAADDLVEWARLLSLPKAGFDQLALAADRRVPLSWQLGASSQRSELNLFYDQAGALAHYLFAADDGRHAQVLFDALTAFYAGTEPVDTPQRVGKSTASIGAAVLKYARQAVGR